MVTISRRFLRMIFFCYNTTYYILKVIVLYCIVLYCIVLYCIVLYCIVLYCIVLQPIQRNLTFPLGPHRVIWLRALYSYSCFSASVVPSALASSSQRPSRKCSSEASRVSRSASRPSSCRPLELLEGARSHVG